MATAQGRREADIAAAMVFNFARFTTWPDEYLQDNDIFKLCLPSSSKSLEAFSALKGRSIKGKTLQVAILDTSHHASLECHLQIIDAKTETTEEEPSKGVLYVALEEGPSADMASLVLIRVGRQTRFIANPKAAKQSDVQLSSKLLDLAMKIR
ncbi:MAG: YfiR family protein [Pseudomonadota bacterium]